MRNSFVRKCTDKVGLFASGGLSHYRTEAGTGEGMAFMYWKP
jgi:hypothetical protein